MDKFIPLEKLSKRKKRELMAKKRHNWGSVNPVTRKPETPKAYKREKTRKWGDDSSADVFFSFLSPLPVSQSRCDQDNKY